ncbi:hypothetical protein BH23GEM6_BH23GEM6_18060 [soil metagenome]
MRPLYVEFVGLPGVGKSTICGEVRLRLEARGIRYGVQASMGNRVVGPAGPFDVLGRRWRHRAWFDKFASYIVLHLKYWKLSLSTYKLILRRATAAREIWRRSRRVLLQLHRIRNATNLVTAGYSDLVLFDQGVVAPLRELVAAGEITTPEQLQPLVIKVLKPVQDCRILIIFLSADVESIVERLANRNRNLGPYDRMNSDQAQTALRRQSMYQLLLMEQIRRFSPPARIFQADMSWTIDSLADAIATMIVSYQDDPSTSET